MIVAHNAASTIVRAVQSALTNSPAPILLVDDFSTDNTANLAQNVAGDRLTIVQPLTHKGVGNARNTALQHLKTPYGIWLDADDEFLPERTALHLEKLQKGSFDLIFDDGVLINGETGAMMHSVSIPDFITQDGKIERQLERNWFPITQCSFNREFAQKIGYDTSFKAAEDYDFMLRALMNGARHGFITEPGYQYYHYPTSLSRALETATDFSHMARMKHSMAAIDRYLSHNNHINAEEKLWTLSLHALDTNDYAQAREHLSTLSQCDGTIAPYPAKAKDLAHFMLGTLSLNQSKPVNALEKLKQLYISWQGAEVSNNIGAAYWQTGKTNSAQKAWQSALTALPGYGDAAANLLLTNTSQNPRITQLPMRPSPSRPYYKIKAV
jgi:glycosyltransferase involved in cell wall biosynthesis